MEIKNENLEMSDLDLGLGKKIEKMTDEQFAKWVTFICEALEEKRERQRNKPLTLEQLKEMVGEPVWYVHYEAYTNPFANARCIVLKYVSEYWVIGSGGYKWTSKNFDETGIDYFKHKPKGSE